MLQTTISSGRMKNFVSAIGAQLFAFLAGGVPATAAELVDSAERQRQRLPIRNALSQAGIPPFKLNDGERQLRQIGRARAKQLTGWLLAADLAIKSHNSADDAARIELERLIVRLAANAERVAS